MRGVGDYFMICSLIAANVAIFFKLKVFFKIDFSTVMNWKWQF